MKFLKSVIISLLYILISSSCGFKPQLSEPVISIAEIEDFRLDGIFDEWTKRQKMQLFCNQSGKTPSKSDLSAYFKIAHTHEGLAFYFHIEDDHSYIDTAYPWNGDVVEIFLAPRKGSEEIMQFFVCLEFSESGVPEIKIGDGRKNQTPQLAIEAKGIKNDEITELEILIGMDEWRIDGDIEDKFAMQVYVDDSDKKRDSEKNRLTWFNANYSSKTSLSYFPATLSKDKEFFPESTSRIVITDETDIALKVFGFLEGDSLAIFRAEKGKAKKLLDERVGHESDGVYDFSNYGLNLEQDSLFVYHNGVCVSFHDLILSPREYQLISESRFYSDIRIFKAKDKFSFPKKASCLFIGSSSIRKWKSLVEDFPELKIIHRGFGGSTSADVLNYMDDIVLPYNASQIVYYEGDNDIAGGISVDSILLNIRSFVEIVKNKTPDTEIFLISPKPAIVRMKYWEKYIELNDKLEDFAAITDNLEFVDVASGMFLPNGELDESIFVEDKLHMNPKGYKIWTKVLREAMSLNQASHGGGFIYN